MDHNSFRKMPWHATMQIMLFTAFSAPCTLYAEEPAASSNPLEGFSISGYIDPTYIYNKDASQSSFRFLNESDKNVYNYDNSTFGDVKLDISKKFANGSNVLITLMPTRGYGGSIIDAAQFTVPLNAELSVFAGKIPAWDGFEAKYSNLTYQVTHSLLYDFSEPGYFTGAGGEYTQGILNVKAMLANSWNSSFNGTNKTPSLVYRFTLTPSKALSFGLFGTVGSEPSPVGGTSTRVYADFDGSYTLDKLLLGWQFDYGRQANGAFNGGTAQWWGGLGVVNYRFTDLVGATFRYDYLNDTRNGGHIAANDTHNGFITDPGDPNRGVKRQSLTFAVLLYPTKQLTTKLELRHDIADLPAFAKQDGTLSNTNDLAAVQLVYAF